MVLRITEIISTIQRVISECRLGLISDRPYQGSLRVNRLPLRPCFRVSSPHSSAWLSCRLRTAIHRQRYRATFNVLLKHERDMVGKQESRVRRNRSAEDGRKVHGVHLRNLHSPALHFRHYRSSPDRPVPDQLLMVRHRHVGLVELVPADVGYSTNQFVEPRGIVVLDQLISPFHIWINRGELRILPLKPLNRPLTVPRKQTTGHSLRLLHAQPHRQVPGRPRRRRHAAPQAHSASCRHASVGSGHRPQNHGETGNLAYRPEFPCPSEGSAYRPETLSLEREPRRRIVNRIRPSRSRRKP